MTATFLVTIDIDTSDSVEGISEQISELLSDELPVLEVKAWSRPSMESTTSSTSGVTINSPDRAAF